MIRLVLWILGGLVLGGIIHIVAVLGVPRFSEEDAWSRVAVFGPDGQFNLIAGDKSGKQPLPMLDPAMTHAVCRFSLNAGPVRIRATLPDTYWSIALFDRRGTNLYSLNDRAADQKPVDILVATNEQIGQVRENPPEEFGDIVVIDWAAKQGFALVRVFVPSRSMLPEIETALKEAKCQTYALVQP